MAERESVRDVSQPALLEIERWMARACASPAIEDPSQLADARERLRLAEQIGRASVAHDVHRELKRRAREREQGPR